MILRTPRLRRTDKGPDKTQSKDDPMGHRRTEQHVMAVRPRSTVPPMSSVPVAPERQLRFACAECQMDITIAEEGRDRLVEGRVSPAWVLQVVHERLSDARSAPADRCGYFSLPRVPRGLGRLVLVTGDGRRLPSAWTVF
jgi:hypothetical protein